MAYHVEIRRGRRWAREFNLDSARLRREVLEPWTAGRAIQLGDREWEPADCSLRILEGPELPASDLAFSRGWDRAQGSGKEVTRELLAEAARDAATVAVLAETESARDAVLVVLQEMGLQAVDWPAPEPPAALVLAVESADPPRAWLYAAGAAVGAAGRRAVVARLGDAPGPPELGDLVAVRPGPELAAALDPLLGRLGPG